MAKVEVSTCNRLSSLLSNADKFTKQGAITLEVSVNESFIEFTVSDTGCGIHTRSIRLSLNVFKKLNDFAQGTGLGLSICQIDNTKMGREFGWILPILKGHFFVYSPYR